jgi:hypothetical protein
MLSNFYAMRTVSNFLNMKLLETKHKQIHTFKKVLFFWTSNVIPFVPWQKTLEYSATL